MVQRKHYILSFWGEFSSLEFTHAIGYKIINAEEFIALHTEGKIKVCRKQEYQELKNNKVWKNIEIIKIIHAIIATVVVGWYWIYYYLFCY